MIFFTDGFIRSHWGLIHHYLGNMFFSNHRTSNSKTEQDDWRSDEKKTQGFFCMNPYEIDSIEMGHNWKPYLNWVVVSNIFSLHPENWGRWTHFDEHIFQRGDSTTN